MDSEPPPTQSRVAVAVDVGPEATELLAELVADTLFTHGASAVAEQPGVDGRCTLVGDLAPDAVATLAADPEWASLGLELRLLEPDAAWNDGWREFARSWRCGPRVVLRPEWVSPDPLLAVAEGGGDAVEVVIEPGGAFGSGSHVTTRLCVAEVDRLIAGGEFVLDVGCGTGVLGVAALLLGAAGVVAIDIDPEARRVTAEVARLNGVEERLRVLDRSLGQVGGTYDLVLANLLLPIVEDLAGDLTARVAPGGRLLVSGVLVDQQARVEAALPQLRLVGTTQDEGWMTLLFDRP